MSESDDILFNHVIIGEDDDEIKDNLEIALAANE